MNIQAAKLWFQRYVLGGLKTPQEVYRDALAENLAGKALPSDRFFQTPDDTGLWDIPQRLAVGSAYFTQNTYLAQSARADWQYTDLRLQLWAALFIEYARKRGIPLYVHAATRSKAEQTAAYQAGHSKTRYPNSAHNIGEAVDIVHSVYQWDLTPKEWQFLQVLGRRALLRVNTTLRKADQLSLNWGGDDGTPSDRFRWDPAHWEITDYRSRIRLVPLADPVHRSPRNILAQVKL